MLALLLVALGLGLDNFAASVSIGMSGVSAQDRLRVAAVFGVFEACLPVVGVLLGHGLAASLGGAARWTSAGLLIATGCYALTQAVRGWRGHDREPASPARLSLARLLVTAAALGIDNLAVGFALGTSGTGLVVAAVVIGSVSVALSMAGLELGRRLGSAAGKYGELLSGLLLAGVGAGVATGVL